jgi:RND family efflux transporter MFP subunit
VRGRTTAPLWAGLATLVVLAGCGEVESVLPGEDPGILLASAGALEITIPAQGELEAVRKTPLSVPDVRLQGLTVSSLIDQGTLVEEGQVIAEFDPSPAVRLLRTEKADFREATLRAEKERTTRSYRSRIVEEEQKKADIDLLQAEGEVESKDPRVTSKHDRLEAELGRDVARIKLDVQKKKGEAQEVVGSADMQILKIAEERTAKELELAEDTLGKMQLKAPHDGIVIFRRRWGGNVEEGQTLWPGEGMGEIPDLSEYQVKCFVHEGDAALVKEGQDAVVSLDGLPGRQLGGKVKSVSKVATRKDRRSPVKYFEVIVAIPEQDPAELRLGMKAGVVIQAGRLADVLVVPRFALHEEGGETWLYVLEEGRPSRRPVELVQGTRDRVAVRSGLEAGEQVLLRGVATEASSEADGEEEG